MIRFIDLKDQIIQDTHEFAFYNTIPDIFVNIAGNYTWDCIECLREDLNEAIKNREIDINRYLNKVPKRFKFNSADKRSKEKK